MKLLAIETSSREGGICLAEDGRMLVEHSLGHGMIHGKALLPAIQGAATRAGWCPDDIQVIAVSLGPGSFTGLRVGLAAAKTLAMVGKADLVGVSTLDVLARNAPEDARYVCPVTDARREEINSCLFERQGSEWCPVWETRTRSAVEILAELPEHCCLLGDALDSYRDAFAQRPDLVKLPEERWWPMATEVARLGWQRHQAGQRDDPHQLVPIYLRLPPVVERLG